MLQELQTSQNVQQTTNLQHSTVLVGVKGRKTPTTKSYSQQKPNKVENFQKVVKPSKVSFYQLWTGTKPLDEKNECKPTRPKVTI